MMVSHKDFGTRRGIAEPVNICSSSSGIFTQFVCSQSKFWSRNKVAFCEISDGAG